MGFEKDRKMGIVLFDNKQNCCGCGACQTICPHQAITMEPDEQGFVYPKINPRDCVECGACIRVCPLRSPELGTVKHTYAAAICDKDQIQKAASGGIFSAAAICILEDGGAVFGAELTFSQGHADVHHIMIEDKQELWKLQGSKYVQSAVGETYRQAKCCLEQGRKVLYSGTPCQIAGLKKYLRKEYSNLYCIDLICHGVPSQAFFDGYIQQLKKRYRGEVVSYRFRDKTKGWGSNILLEINDGKKTRKVYKKAMAQSYGAFFLRSKIYRDSCYCCPFAGPRRPGDLTIGDYWGIAQEHPELKNNPDYAEQNGVSCLLVNTEKGAELMQRMGNSIHITPSEIAKVAKHNAQLKSPSVKPEERQVILQLYQNHGYAGVEQYFRKRYFAQTAAYTIYDKMPRKLGHWLKTVLKG